MSVTTQLGQRKIIAVIRLDDLSGAVDLVRSLLAGGVSVFEFTLTNPEAAQTIAAVRATLGAEVLVGAGSVTTPEQVALVADHGAQFVVSPITKAQVIAACHKLGLPAIPGAYTPTEIQTAWEMDVAAVKLFPAGGLGPRYIKDVLAPLPHLRLIPTGGIGSDNIKSFFTAGAFAVGVGSALFDKTDLDSGNWAAITASARRYSEALQ